MTDAWPVVNMPPKSKAPEELSTNPSTKQSCLYEYQERLKNDPIKKAAYASFANTRTAVSDKV